MFNLKFSYQNKFALISFFLMFFFTLFPRSLPFQPVRQEIGVAKLSEGNIFNQIINISIFTLTTIAAIPKINQIVLFIKREKFLSLLLLWALITILWSNFPMVSFRRWFQFFILYLNIITFLTYFNYNDLIKIIKHISYIYIILTLITVLTIPEAKDPQFNSWRGLTPHKNNLGAIGVILTVVTLIIYTNENKFIKKNIAVLFFLLSIIITLGTLSSTSYLSLFIFLAGTLFFYLMNTIYKNIGVSKFIFLTIVLTSLIIFLIIFISFPQITDFIQDIFGKSETFYDRGKLWSVMLWEISKHPLHGCGFQSFWTIENPTLLLLYQTFVWLPNQAHNGYLDLINELGFIGLILFLIMIFKIFERSIKNGFINLWLWLIILPLISNITESNFFSPGTTTSSFLIISYLIQTNSTFKLNRFYVNTR